MEREDVAGWKLGWNVESSEQLRYRGGGIVVGWGGKEEDERD
jgi:hypothetical protein